MSSGGGRREKEAELPSCETLGRRGWERNSCISRMQLGNTGKEGGWAEGGEALPNSSGSSPLFSSTRIELWVQVTHKYGALSTSQVFEYKWRIRIDFLIGLSPFPKVLLSLAQTNFEPTEYMKLHEKCELLNIFYVATFHFKLDFRQTRILNLATATRPERR